MKRVVTPLRQMGADIRAKDDNFPPLEIRGGKLRAIHYEMPMASAQVKSAVLLAGLFADGETSLTEPARTRDHTEIALEEFGAPIERHARTIHIRANGEIKLTGRRVEVPGDLSSAVFFIAAASLFPESSLHIQAVGLNPTRTAILDVLSRMGASIQVLSLRSARDVERSRITSALERTTDGIWEWDLAEDRIFMSDVTAALFGWRGGLRPMAHAVMSALSEWLLPRGTRVELNRDEYVQPGPYERAQTAQILNSIVDARGNVYECALTSGQTRIFT
jgi:PAS domain-containing protein